VFVFYFVYTNKYHYNILQYQDYHDKFSQLNKKYKEIRYIFSNNLRKLRKLKGLSQENASQKIGIKQNTWSNYENGKSYPDPEIIEDIIKLLDIERNQLFENTNKRASDNNLNPSYNFKIEHTNLIEYINVLENTGELRIDISNNLKSYILLLFKEINDQKERLIKQHEKYEALRDTDTSKS